MAIRYFFLILLLSASGTGFGAERNLNSSDLKLTNFETLSGRFNQSKILKELDVTLATNGSFQISRPKSDISIIHWNVESPKVSHICIDQIGVVLGGDEASGAAAKKMNFSEIGGEAKDQMSGLMKLISMDPEQINKDFKITKKGSEFELTPMAKNSLFNQAWIRVNAQGLIEQIVIQEKTKDEIKVQFTSLKTRSLVKEDQCTR